MTASSRSAGLTRTSAAKGGSHHCAMSAAGATWELEPGPLPAAAAYWRGQREAGCPGPAAAAAVRVGGGVKVEPGVSPWCTAAPAVAIGWSPASPARGCT